MATSPSTAVWVPLLPRLKPYAQLVRLPNVFTALADIGLGALATQSLPAEWLPFLLLALASACLYCGGMVWNDFFDVEQDRRERPFRPIPSGRVSRRAAGQLGLALLLVGLVFAALAGWRTGGFTPLPLGLALALVACILLYDAWLKHTALGPLGMGACRFFNVLLGLTVVPGPLPPWSLHVAAVVGVYIVGVTWFARTEARVSKRTTLAAAGLTMLAGLGMAVFVPVWLPPDTGSPLFPYLLVALAFVVGIPVGRAIRAPLPAHVQAAVKRAIMGLVGLDAVLATGLAGAVGLVLLLLLWPALWLGKRLYST